MLYFSGYNRYNYSFLVNHENKTREIMEVFMFVITIYFENVFCDTFEAQSTGENWITNKIA